MKIGLVGFPGCGKSTVFNALTGLAAETGYGAARGKTNLGAVKHVAFQRFVRVAAGAHPKFNWKLTYPTDKCGKAYVSDGSNQVWQYWCTNKSSSISGTIGTRG